MQKLCRTLLLCSATVASFAWLADAQDAQDVPSLGDVARQARQQKQKDTQNKDTQAKKPKVMNDDNIVRSLPDETANTSGNDHAADPAALAAAPSGKLSADEWKSRIETQRDAVTSLQHNIDQLDKSIQFAPGNCVAGCVEWNKHQKEKQQEVENMKEQLKAQQKALEDMQEAARQQGYGSSVTDP
ncbi:MAG TPA: hypothetical protein VEI01_20010 [Terriglobales bacterium]|nr:hypothetical protein [Terriglobales bacterium]